MKRESVIRKLAAEKDVLDIGSVGQTGAYNLWDNLKATAKTITGIDTQASDVDGIVLGDMEAYDFKRKFDIIVAGDVIEHVSNQGLFLDNIKRHLKDDGTLIITTPNAKWWTVFLRPNKTHTLWHDRHTLVRILETHGFVVERLIFYPGNKRTYFPLLLPLIFRQSLMVVCRKKSNR
jgi:2-polyprenyl-3-methyl-5-hydroxy-6-metoxy-1,4-benzoquinol methylase